MRDSMRPRVDPGQATLWLAVATVTGAVIASGVTYLVQKETAVQSPSPTVTVTVTVPGPTVTSTEIVKSVEPVEGNTDKDPTSAGASSSPKADSLVRLNDVAPITDENLWETQTVQVRGETIRNALVVTDSFSDRNDWSDTRHIPLNGKYSRLTGAVAIADGGFVETEAAIEIEVDGEFVVSGTLTIGQKPILFDLDLIGAEDLKLIVTKTAGRTTTGSLPHRASIVFIDGKLVLT